MKKLLIILAMTMILSMTNVLAKTIILDNANTGNCLGTDCEYQSTAIGTVTITDCRDKLYLNVSLSGLDTGNYQITIQTYSGDKRLDSTEVCAKPNAPMGVGTHINAWECGSWSDYSFYNFEMDALTANGNFQESYIIDLPKGNYNVILLVKHDKIPEGTGGASYPIVLQKGNVTWTIADYCCSLLEERVTVLEEQLKNIQLIPGPQGPAGPKGDTGEQGHTGDMGPQGEKGATGDTGEQGIQGKDGTNGVNGVDGFNCWDLNQNYACDFLTEDKNLDGICSTLDCQGIQGIQGIQGEIGLTGLQGIQGLQGEQGIQGDTGAQGIQGEKGDKSEQGEIGPQGPKGDAGQNGTTDLTDVWGNITALWLDDTNKWTAIYNLETRTTTIENTIISLQTQINDLKTYIDNKLILVWDDITNLWNDDADKWTAIHNLQTGNNSWLVENCNTKDTKVCNDGKVVTKDYYCNVFGTDTQCLIGHCQVKTTSQWCSYGCLNAVCKPAPENCNAKDTVVCNGKTQVKTDYYCTVGQGSDYSCNPGQCLSKVTNKNCPTRCTTYYCY